LRPRSMLFTLYGDYAYPERRDVPLRGLVEIGQALGLSEVAMRSAVARFAREGWVEAHRQGARARYGLSEAGRRLIEEGTRRIYRPGTARWTGRWCVLTYSIPEKKRAHRDRIRKQLAWLGFGPMGGGAYASPRDAGEAALALLRRHDVHAYARVFSGALEGPGTDADLVEQCWDLDKLAARYRAFVSHYEPLYRRDRALRANRRLSDREAFVTRFALTHDFRRFPFIDPDLPERLLPRRWPGIRARSLFEAHNALLRPGAFRFFDRIADGDA
jgi:phenylacetic acid degradation operon negative regulatory protein